MTGHTHGPAFDRPPVEIVDVNGNPKSHEHEILLYLTKSAAQNSMRIGDAEQILGGDGMFTRSGLAIDAREALLVSTVFACRRIIAEDIASMSIEVVRRTRKADRVTSEVLPDHPLMDLLSALGGKPNDWMTIFELIEHWVGVATMYRGGYCFINRNDRGEVLEILPLLPGAVQVFYNASWEPEYYIHGYGQTWRADGKNLLKLHGPMDDRALQGMPVSNVGREAIALASAVEGAAARFHKNDMRPSGALFMKAGNPPKEVLDRIKSDWKGQFGPGGEGGIALLTGDFDFKAFNATSADSQTIENRKFQVEEICRYFRVFPVVIGHQAGQGYGTTENFFEAHYTHTLRPWEIKVEQSLNTQLLTAADRKAGLFIRLKPARRGTFTDRVNAYKNAVTVFMTPNEVRAEEGLDRLDGEAMDMVQLAANNTGLHPSITPPGGKPPSDGSASASAKPAPAAASEPSGDAEPKDKT